MTISMALPPDIEAFVKQFVADGEYESPEQLIIAAVRLLREREADIATLRAEIEKGLDGPGIPVDEAFAMLRARFNLPAAGQSN